MPRVRHNDSGDPAEDPCAGCGHLRRDHRDCNGGFVLDPAECTKRIYDAFDPEDLTGSPCRCQRFVKRRAR
jgi:hypothetical protein